MGLKDLCEHLGARYKVDTDIDGNVANVKIYSSKEKIWAYRKPVDVTTLSGLFKEVYADAIEDILPNSPFLVDKPKKK